MIRGFQILAVILCGVAVFLWWQDNTDWAFASGVLAAAAYFLTLRFQMKERVNLSDAKRKIKREAEEPGSEEDISTAAEEDK
jgi:hypothetical protein